jgi:CheY-like chemotaxis protein
VTARRVLIVDDNEDVTEMLSMMASSLGHEVRAATNGEAGLVLAATFRPDIVLLDLSMPDPDGFAVATRLRAMTPCAAVHLIALTGWEHAGLEERTAAAGFDRLCRKPVTRVELRELLGLADHVTA